MCMVTVRAIIHKSVYKQYIAHFYKKLISKHLVCLLYPEVVRTS